MTGEMHTINPNGIDSNGDEWPQHAELARRLGGTLEPFDKYQGPYICLGPDVRAGLAPYAVPLVVLGTTRLWLCADWDSDGLDLTIYNEATDKSSPLIPWIDDLIESEARALLARPSYYECGICGHLHPTNWNGDCRQDSARFTAEHLDEKYGPEGWTETDMPD